MKVFTSIETVEGITVINSSPFFSTNHSMNFMYILKDMLLVFKQELDNLLGCYIVDLYIK